MERLQYHEFGMQLKMFKLVRENPPNEQLKRKRQKDQLRDAKIKACTDMLRDDPLFTVVDFLESLANKTVLPGIGEKMLITFVIYYVHINKFLAGRETNRKRMWPYEEESAAKKKKV